MTATPTPGDLSARTRLLNCAVDAINDYAALVGDDHDVGTCNCDLVDIANGLAALSALPAAGEPVVWMMTSDAYKRPAEFYRERPAFVPPTSKLIPLYTTPQPSAAEEVEWDGATRTMQEHLYLMTGERDRYKALHEQAAPTIARIERRIAEMDAAVGAQGDGWPALPWRDINECPESDDLFWFRRGDTIDGPRPPAPDDADYWDWFAPCEAPSSAAPAAGKGVDDAADEDAFVIEKLSRLLAEIAVIVKGPEPANGVWGYHDLPELVCQKIALTRQPVAGDGNDAANWRRAKACMSAIGQSDKSVSYACALLLSENTRKVNAGRAEITLRGITDGDEECGDWRITVEQLAAPAATPTDGGEG